MTVQLRHRGLVVDRDALDALRAEFERRHCVHIKSLLEPGLARAMVAALDRSMFADRTHDGIGIELVAQSGLATGVLELLANDPQLFDAVRTLTGCGPIGCFDGRVYRMVPASGHYDSWHSDNGMDRSIAMSINLSPEPYEGGLLQIREQKSTDVVCQVANIGLGDAILFRISPTLTHRVTNVEGRFAKTAYAGWFRSRPSFRELVRERSLRARATHPAQR